MPKSKVFIQLKSNTITRSEFQHLYDEKYFNLWLDSYDWKGITREQREYLMRKFWELGEVACFAGARCRALSLWRLVRQYATAHGFQMGFGLTQFFGSIIRVRAGKFACGFTIGGMRCDRQRALQWLGGRFRARCREARDQRARRRRNDRWCLSRRHLDG